MSFLIDPPWLYANGRVLAKASHNKEEILIGEIDLALIEETRRNWPFLRDRRIDKPVKGGALARGARRRLLNFLGRLGCRSCVLGRDRTHECNFDECAGQPPKSPPRRHVRASLNRLLPGNV